VHVRISSPPVMWPCFYGIDFATRAELVAHGLGVEEVRASIGADSLGYISLDGMVGATRQPREHLCTACFTGEYPVPLPAADLLGKHALEAPPAVTVVDARRADDDGVRLGDADGARVDKDADGVPVGLSVGGGDALLRP
jgi:amidophosphoribosyltransferase